MLYLVKRASRPPRLEGAADDGWSAADVLDIAHFHPRSSPHRPQTRVRLLYDADAMYVEFDVQDQYVVCTNTEYQSRVSGDSCVEFFVEPVPAKGYFNFEINCGGAMLLYYIEDPARAPDALFSKFAEVPEPLGRQVRIVSTLPRRVIPEITGPQHWRLRCHIPFTVLEPFVGPLAPEPGEQWRANFFKCADQCSHPHWASWSPIGEELRFHQPKFFAPLEFTD